MGARILDCLIAGNGVHVWGRLIVWLVSSVRQRQGNVLLWNCSHEGREAIASRATQGVLRQTLMYAGVLFSHGSLSVLMLLEMVCHISVSPLIE